MLYCLITCTTIEPSCWVCSATILYCADVYKRQVQIKLVPVNAPYFDGADLLVAADCTAYALSLIHI